MKVYEVPLTLAKHDADMNIKACTQKLIRFCANNFLRYQVTICPLVLL